MDKIIQRIKQSQNFVVTSHVNPDGDNVGSSVAMTKYLQKMGKKAVHALTDCIPDNLLFLLEDHQILKSAKEVQDFFGQEPYDLIVLDSADKNRIALDQEIIQKAEQTMNIDHHMSNDQYGDINYVVPSIGSTCQVLCNILREMDESLIRPEIATAIYAGISTDTGNFMFASVDEDTFMTAAFLTKKQADRNLVANEIYRNTSLEFRMLTKLVLDTFTIIDQVGMMVMSQEMLEQSQVDYKDTDMIVNLAIDTKGVQVGVLVKENGPDLFKISLRSKDKVNVCAIANQFGGGGHFNASGCTMEGKLEDVIQQLQEAAAKQIQKDLTND